AQSSKLKAQSSKLKAQSSKLKAQSSKLKAQSSIHPLNSLIIKIMFCDEYNTSYISSVITIIHNSISLNQAIIS
ncbi:MULTISPECIES: hypothetical protein, partial [unclassified Arcicella]|uniref:hypothetical protein n=1 Tax=unclassified Arcicella TaxID=2644986 RepID=UPI00286C06D0